MAKSRSARAKGVVFALAGATLVLAATGDGLAASSAEAPAYSVKLVAKRAYKRGQKDFVDVVIEAKPGFKINDKYPTKFTADAPPAGVVFTRRVLSAADGNFGKQRGVLHLELLPRQGGVVRIGGKAAFSVCSDSACIVGKQHLDVALTVS